MTAGATGVPAASTSMTKLVPPSVQATAVRSPRTATSRGPGVRRALARATGAPAVQVVGAAAVAVGPASAAAVVGGIVVVVGVGVGVGVAAAASVGAAAEPAWLVAEPPAAEPPGWVTPAPPSCFFAASLEHPAPPPRTTASTIELRMSRR